MEEQTTPIWLEGKNINEKKFAKAFLEKHELVYCDNAFFGKNGRVDDERRIKRAIYQMAEDHLSRNLARTVDSLYGAVKTVVPTKKLDLDPSVIHVANGTFDLQEGFLPEKRFCRHRLPVNFGWNIGRPEVWEKFLEELLSPLDILTLQEFMGYCLIPTTKAQRMLIITGSGGEGKSRIGVVMRAILGNNMVQGSIAKLEQSPFARADLEHMLLMVDDDMQMEALSSTNILKSIVTAEGPMDLERKGKQSHQGILKARIMGFGNEVLRSLHDRSNGFFRRQIILRALPRDPDREDDPDLGEKLVAEKDAIFMWCLEGLWRLLHQNYQFTLSEEAQCNLNKAVRESNNIIDFMASTGYIAYQLEARTTSKRLYQVYQQWCQDNALRPLSDRTFWNYLRSHTVDYQLEYTDYVPIENGRHARGFRGIRVVEEKI